MSTIVEPGSFRDWDGRVFSARRPRASAHSRTAGAAGLGSAVGELSCSRGSRSSGELVATRSEDGDETLEALCEQSDPGAGAWVAALSHERVPFVSYPYEWPFSMLKDAALLQLRLTSAALAEGLDAQGRVALQRPMASDPSRSSSTSGRSSALETGEPWSSVSAVLHALPLSAACSSPIAASPSSRGCAGSVDGISPLDFRALFTRRDALASGDAAPRLPARQASSAGTRIGDPRCVEELAAAGFDQAARRGERGHR